MVDLGWTAGRTTGASDARPVHDLNELYWRTKAAQAEAERHGFAGMAAALGEMAAKLACEPGVDPALVGALAGGGLAGGSVLRTGASTSALGGPVAGRADPIGRTPEGSMASLAHRP